MLACGSPRRNTPSTGLAANVDTTQRDYGSAVTLTESKVAVASVVPAWLVRARPTWMLVSMDIVSLPTRIHETPSSDRNALKVFPFRSSFTQAGAVPAPPAVCVD